MCSSNGLNCIICWKSITPTLYADCDSGWRAAWGLACDGGHIYNHAVLHERTQAVEQSSSLLSLLEQYKAWSPISALYVPICSTMVQVNGPATVAINEQFCNVLWVTVTALQFHH